MPKVSDRRSKILSILTLTSLGGISMLACDDSFGIGSGEFECGLFESASVTSLAVGPPAVTLPLGGSDTLTATVRYDDCPVSTLDVGISWFVRDTAVVKLGPCAGLCEVLEIMAVGVGETVVSAYKGGFDDSTQVTVTSN